MKFVLIFFLLPAPLICIETEFNSSMCFSPADTSGSNICQQNPNNLSCGEGKLIMIKGIKYKQTTGSAGNNCSACDEDGNVTNWNITPSYFEYRLHQLCSVQEMCVFNETVKVPTNESNYVWNAEISYTCIQNDTGNLNDICSSWEKNFGSDGLHIWLQQAAYKSHICSCIIEGNNTNILVVDYRPYHNDFLCADSTVLINGDHDLQCSHLTGVDYSLYNTLINVTSSRINITLVIQNSLPAMFWLYLQDSDDARVWCNTDSNWTSLQTRQTTSTKVTTSTFVSQTTSSTTEVVTSKTTFSKTSSPISNQDEDFTESGIPISIIVGGLLGLMILCVLISITICLVRKRKLRKESRPRFNNETEHNSVSFENKQKAISKSMNGIINPAYDPNNGEARLHPQSDQGVDTDSVYSKPFDTIEDGNYTEVSETLTQERNSYVHKKKNETQDSEELYGEIDKNNIFIDGEKILKNNGNAHVYNTLSELDTYSHIHDVTGQKEALCLDNYSHVKVKNTGIYYENTGKGAAFYNQIEPVYNNEPLQGHKYDEDEEEYDHIGHLKPRLGESCL